MAHPAPVTQITRFELAPKSFPSAEKRLMAATQLAGLRNKANPTRLSRRLETRQIALVVSEKICRRRNAGTRGSGNHSVGRALRRMAPAIANPRPRVENRVASCITISEPNAPAPRYETLNHPPTDPRRSS